MIPISIIIPTYNRGAPLLRALESVVAQNFPRTDYEVLVIDNASTDNTRALAEAAIQKYSGHAIRYIYEPVPGLLSSRHRGAAESQGSILVYTDDDIEADRGWLAAIHDAFQDPQVHVVGGRSHPNYAIPPPPWIDQIFGRGPDDAVLYCGTYSLIDLGELRREIDPNHVWGLNFSIRKQTLYRLGGFHPDITPRQFQRYQGDGETGLTMKLKEHGLKAIYEPRALVRHLVSAERLTMEYVEKHQYYWGICDSYTSIRKTKKFGIVHFATMFPVTEQEMLAYRMNTAYMCGYNYHQAEVKKDPRLLRWVLKEDYFDYRYPE